MGMLNFVFKVLYVYVEVVLYVIIIILIFFDSKNFVFCIVNFVIVFLDLEL